ncbi:MAG TPA: hypothetical protein DHV62_04195 [Elusimicrobia bacterium]|jgi:DNA-binding transcriptional MerR regulator|nr:hypothetical protein [Elusimicrobiota bacterium]
MPKKKNTNNNLLKVSEIAREAGVLPSTIRYYTRLGVLTPKEIWTSGYRLYEREETLHRIRLIREYMKKKPTLEKFKEMLPPGVDE